MKYANYSFKARGVNNLGDNMQIIAIDEIYKRMGVDSEDIVYIDTNDLSTYNGEYVILPVTLPLVDYRSGGVVGRFSDHIVPVFLGLTMVNETLHSEEVAYYRLHEPIGCRDERTMNTLRKYRIDAYLHGCITVTFPKRKMPAEELGKVYIVDLCEGAKKFIPPELIERATYKTHFHQGALDSPKKLMQEYYDEYKNQAGLVITSLLHCSVPCMAAGIPVVLARESISYRLGWLEKLLPIYETKEFPSINWTPEAVDLEDHKKRVLDFTINRLQRKFDQYSSAYDLSFFYETRKKKAYTNDACDSLKRYIDEKWIQKDANYQYSIWGLNQIAEWIVEYIKQHYKNARLMHAYDAFRTERFEGLISESPELIKDNLDEIVLITTNGAEKAAKDLFAKIKKPEGTYAFMKVEW